MPSEVSDVPRFNLDDPRFQSNPWPVYQRFRAQEPVYLAANGAYYVFRHDAVRILLCTKAIEQPFRTTRRAFGPSMLDREGAHHLRLRSLAAGRLRPKQVDVFEDSIIKPAAVKLLDRVMHGNPTDLVRSYARELPSAVFCRVMGIPAEDGPWLYSVLSRLIAHIDQDGGNVAEVTAQRKVLRQYFERLLADRDYHDGLLGRFADAADEFTTASDVVNNATMLLAAGTETTALALGTLLARLAVHPELLDEMRTHPWLIPAAVSELLRHEPPLHFITRFLAEDVEVDGVAVQAGTAVQLSLGSANHDEKHYANPEQFDAHRAETAPLTFGFGVHRCLGADLASRELAVTISILIERGLALELAVGGPPRVEGRVFRGVRQLVAAVKPRERL